MGKLTALTLGLATLALVAGGLALLVGLVLRGALYVWRRR